MSSLIRMIQQIARNEVDRLHTLELGVIETVNVHETGDDVVNYDCNVLLKGRTTKDGESLKLEHIPLATDHTGSVIVPYVNDLVLVSFINGNFAMPVIIGRLYSVEKRAPLYREGEHRMTFDPRLYRKGERNTSDEELQIDRRIIDFRGLPEEGKFEHEYLIQFNSGTMVRYDESTVDMVTNFLSKKGDEAEPSDNISHFRLQGKGEKESSILLETGFSGKKPSAIDGRRTKKLSEMDLGAGEKTASISLNSGDEDRSTIIIERGDSRIEILTEKPSGKDKAVITVRAGTSKITLKQDGDVEITTDENIDIRSGGAMRFDAKGPMSFTADKIEMEAGNDIGMKSGKNLSVESGTAMKMESGTNMDVRSGTALKMEAITNMDINAGMTGKLQATTALAIKGLPVQIN